MKSFHSLIITSRTLLRSYNYILDYGFVEVLQVNFLALPHFELRSCIVLQIYFLSCFFIRNLKPNAFDFMQNNIPVFCPGLTNDSLGDMLYFHSFRNPRLIIDVVQDIRAMNVEVVHESPRKTGMIILGG
ncbi:hypothetical protein IC582_019861 [Cucumis melo]